MSQPHTRAGWDDEPVGNAETDITAVIGGGKMLIRWAFGHEELLAH